MSGFAPTVSALAVAEGLNVAGEGVRMPAQQLASLDRPEQVADAQPAGSEQRGSAFLPEEVAAPTVPNYPRKQARH